MPDTSDAGAEHQPTASAGAGVPLDPPTATPAEPPPSERYQFIALDAEQEAGCTTWLGRDRALDRPVRLLCSTDAEGTERLAMRARFLARLEDAGVPAVHDLVRTPAGAVLAMRRIDGIRLDEAMRMAAAGDAPPEITTAHAIAHILQRASEAIAAAHRAGVVHGHLTAERICIGAGGRICISGWERAITGGVEPGTAQRAGTAMHRSTSRFGSGSAAAGRQQPDGRHDDVRALGLVLAQAALRRPADAARPSAPGDDELEALPHQLATIARSAIASSPTQGFDNADDLADALQRAVGQLAAEPQAMGTDRCLRPLHSRRRLIALAAIAIAGVLLWLVPWQSAVRSAVEASTDFAHDAWQGTWVPGQAGSFEQTPAGLRTVGLGENLLIHGKRLAVPLAVEYAAMIEPGAHPGDLSLIWSERESLDREPWNLKNDAQRLLLIQHGAFENTHSTLRDDGGRQVLARDNRRLQSGRIYRMRVELLPDSITASIDDEVVMRSELAVPLTSGYVAFYGHYPGKLLRSARITQPATRQPSPFEAGDALLRTQHYEDASAAYGAVAELAPGTPVAEQAWYRKGYAERLAGRTQQSRRAWAALRDPELLARAEILQLDDLIAAGNRDLAYARFDELWRIADPANRRILVQRWQGWMRAATTDREFDDAQLQTLLGVRSGHFADDAVSGEVTAWALVGMHRFDAVLADFPSYSQQRHLALLSLGRGDEVLAGDWALSWQRAHARFVVGDMEAVLKDPYSSADQRAMALCKLDRAAEAIPLTPDRHPGLLHAGRAHDLLTDAKTTPESAAQALLALGRSGELLASQAEATVNTSAYRAALRLAGRLDEAEKLGGKPLPGLRLLAALESGKGIGEAVTALRRAYTPLIHTDIGAGNWFGFAVLDAYAGWIADGQVPTAAAALREKAKLLTNDVARRPTLICAVIAGDLPPERLAELPFRSEAEAWTALAIALRAELAGERTAAVAAYARFAALPLHRRLLDDNLPNAEVERFVAWRQRVLQAP